MFFKTTSTVAMHVGGIDVHNARFKSWHDLLLLEQGVTVENQTF
jgi:hypothetical protein